MKAKLLLVKPERALQEGRALEWAWHLVKGNLQVLSIRQKSSRSERVLQDSGRAWVDASPSASVMMGNWHCLSQGHSRGRCQKNGLCQPLGSCVN